MIYCREKLIDIVLDSAWVSLEEKFDFDIALDLCLRRSLFSKKDWENTEHFLSTGESYTESIYKVIVVLQEQLGYTDEKFLVNLSAAAVPTYKYIDSTKRGERL